MVEAFYRIWTKHGPCSQGSFKSNKSFFLGIHYNKSREELRKYGKGQTSSKYKVKVGMLEIVFEGGEWGRKRVTKSSGDGKAQGSLWKRNWSGLARA